MPVPGADGQMDLNRGNRYKGYEVQLGAGAVGTFVTM